MNRILQLIMLLLMIILGLTLHYILLPNLSPYEDKRALELILIVLTLVWVCLGGVCAFLTTGDRSRYLLGSLFSMGIFTLLSSLFAASPRHALLEVSHFLGLAYLSILISVSWNEYRIRFLVALVAAIALGATFYMIGFYTGYLASFLEQIPLVWPEPFYMLSNVRQFNQYQLWTLGLLCLPLLLNGWVTPRLKPGLCSLLYAWWVLLFASGSRGVLLAWLMGMLAAWWVYRQLARSFLLLQLKCFSFGFLAYQLLFIWLPRFNAGGGSVTQTALRSQTGDRLYLWTHAWHMIQAHPWLGVGPMHFAWYPNEIAAHPHNSIVQLACEWGLSATGLILLLAFWGVYRWLQRFNAKTLADVSELESMLAVALFFTLVASAVYSLVDGVIVMPLSQVMMAVVVGLMLGLYRYNSKTDMTEASVVKPGAIHSKVSDYAHRLFAGVALVVMVWAVLPELLPRILGDYDMIPTGYQVMGPRFWQEGGIPHDD